jgi:hypothetical protein
MTIGIGVLASVSVKPDALVMIADTMGSFEDDYSTSELHKLHAIESEDLYAVSADQIDRAGEQINMLTNVLRKDFPGPRKYPDILRALVKTASLYKNLRFEIDALPQLRMSVEDWFKVQDPHLRDSILAAYNDFYVGCQTLVGTFSANGQAYLFSLPGNGTVQNCTFPGFAVVGTGSHNAQFWLSHRKHTLSHSLKRAAYHAFEAKVMAESSPHVNEHLDLVAAQKGKSFLFYPERQEVEGAPFSIPELRKLFKRLNVKSTRVLDPEEQGKKPIYE